jgi:hypothetical protein
MTFSRKYAAIAMAALDKVLPPGIDLKGVAEIVESVLAEASREHKEEERQHLAEIEATSSTAISPRCRTLRSNTAPQSTNISVTPSWCFSAI